jgi:hypothetical protein
VAIGAVLRLVRYGADRSLWGDEAALALNLIDRSTSGLLDQLSYVQGAPTGFLLTEKGAVGLFGRDELALRLFPLLCGIASLVLFAVVARRVLRPQPAMVAVALFATCDPLVYYSSEVKQYETDVLAAVALVAIGVMTEWRSLSLPHGIAIAVAGAALAWLSHASLIVLASIALVLLVVFALSKERSALRSVSALATCWGVSAIGAYVVNASTARQVGHATLAVAETSGGRLSGPLRDVWHAYAHPVGLARTTTALALLVTVAGFASLVRRHWDRALIVVAPIAVTFLAALAGQYPFSDRFILFLVPFFFLLIAEGVWELATRTWAVMPVFGVAAVAVLLLYPFGTAVRDVVSPPGHEEVKPVLRVLASRWRPGDSLFVWYQTQYPFRYYAECRECNVLPAHGVTDVVWPRTPPPGAPANALETHPPLYLGYTSHGTESYGDAFRPLLGKPRVWLVFSSTWDDALVRYLLDCQGRRLYEMHTKRAALYLYDLSSPQSATGVGCLPG